MTKEEILNKVTELVDSAWEFGFAQGVNETSKTYMDKLKQKQAEIDTAYDDGYKAGHKAALDGMGLTGKTEDEVEPKAPLVFDLTNDAVKAFMADKTYDVAGFATGKGKSVVEKYSVPYIIDGKYKGNWIEKPKLVETPNFIYYNLIPGKEYTIEGVRIKTTGTVRQIYFPDDEYVSNCRDLGGYKCEGGKVKYGMVIRSAHLPDDLTKNSVVANILRDDVGVTLEIDLRNKSVYTNLGWKGKKVLMYGYATILTDARGYKDTFNAILSELEAGGCVLIHCSAGADRTGTVAALLLGLLGVSEADIIKDWELTSFCHWCNFKIISQWAERIADPTYRDTSLKEFPKGELREFFVAMKKAYGTKGETFQQQCVAFMTKKVGFTSAQIERLKKAMIES